MQNEQRKSYANDESASELIVNPQNRALELILNICRKKERQKSHYRHILCRYESFFTRPSHLEQKRVVWSVLLSANLKKSTKTLIEKKRLKDIATSSIIELC